MKNFIIFFGIAALAASLFVGTGCKTTTTTNPNGTVVTNQVVNAALVIPIINGVVPVAVQIAAIKESDSIPYFRAACVVIDTLANNGIYDPNQLQAALAGLHVTSQGAMLAIQAGLSIYRSFAADAVTAQLDKKELIAVLRAFSSAIRQGLDTSITPGTRAITIQVK